jgi:hypothetical protein
VWKKVRGSEKWDSGVKRVGRRTRVECGGLCWG